MQDYYMKNNRFFTREDKKPIFQLLNCTIVDYNEEELRLKSKSLDKIIPIFSRIHHLYGIENPFLLDDHGLSFRMHFHNRIDLRPVIDKRLRYNVEFSLYSKNDEHLIFKILKITDKKHVELDYPEPDGEDIRDIRNSIVSKVDAFKTKFCELSESAIRKMTLRDLTELEENLCDFVSRNV